MEQNDGVIFYTQVYALLNALDDLCNGHVCTIAEEGRYDFEELDMLRYDVDMWLRSVGNWLYEKQNKK